MNRIQHGLVASVIGLGFGAAALGDSLKHVVQGQAERESLRTVLGTETVQQALFKDQ